MRIIHKSVIAIAFIAMTVASQASVTFQNTGTTSGWSATNARQTAKISQVSSPTFKGGTALAHECNWAGAKTANHAEVMKYRAQLKGQDRYYGQAIRVPSNWVFRDANITFQQFTHEQNVSGAWIMNWLDKKEIKINLDIKRVVGTISAGVWTRVVFRLKATNNTDTPGGGAQEYWTNGKKTVSRIGVASKPPNDAESIRWSSGIYVTYWRNATTLPGGDMAKRLIYHDHLRIATSYAEAEPNNW